jgi:hypothetical protein
MKTLKKKKPSPTAGHVIGISTLAMVGMMAAMTVLFLVGVGLVVGWFTSGLTIWALIGGILMILICPLAVAFGVYRMRIKERLVVGADCFQILHRVQDRDEVITQIPYANMSAVEFEMGTQSNYIGIHVNKLDDPNTYQKHDDFESTKSVRGCHCIIDPGYTESLEAIYDRLAEKFKQYHPSHEK